MITITGPISGYFMPVDAIAARAALIATLALPAEKWVVLYEASMIDFFSTLIASQGTSTPVHIFADASLAKRPIELGRLTSCKNAGIEVVIGSSITSRYFICHQKAVACMPEEDGVESMCWDGSVNFSEQSWGETNTGLNFRSDNYRVAFVAAWNAMKANALATMPDAQI
jgi:hypothetical protein